ncbi:hypothetical protein D3C84_667950 [compost metagenome]
MGRRALLIVAEGDFGDQLVTGGVGEIVVQVLFAIEVDLGGQVAMIRRGNEEVHVRRALAMTAQLIEQLLGRTVRRAAITRRHDALEAIAAFGIGHDTATQVELRLAAIEVRIGAAGVGVPDIHHGAGQRRAIGVLDLALHEQHHTRIDSVVQARKTVGQRRAGHVQRAFDGARGAAGLAGLLVFGVHQQVQVVFQAKACNQQAGFLACAQLVEVVDGFPELLRGHLQVFNDVHRIAQDAVDQRLGPWIALVVEQAAGVFEELLGAGSVGNSDVHD